MRFPFSPQDFVVCALSRDYVGWVLAVHSGTSALSLAVIYQLSRQMKRLHITIWIAFFQAGIGIVVAVWLPGNHDMPIFFVIAGIFGITEAGFTALMSGKK